MTGKLIHVLAVSLVATAGFSWLTWAICQPDKATAMTDKTSQPTVEEASLLPALFAADKPAAGAVKVVNAYPKLTFDAPIEYTYANDGTNRVFVVEQAGQIKVFDNNPNAAAAQTYLDIRKLVTYGGEMGLLGLAFHPKFSENGYFFVNYTKDNPRETVVSRFKASSVNDIQVDPKSEVILFKVKDPYSNHNGGKVLFGPDGYLYISSGDGGSGGDPQNNGQDRRSWLGKILRVDVNSIQKGNYGIPDSNPFANNKEGLREEIYAYGLRNPWRMSFDGRAVCGLAT